MYTTTSGIMTTKEKNKKVGFLDLPGEIRNIVYRQLLTSSTPIDLMPLFNDSRNHRPFVHPNSKQMHYRQRVRATITRQITIGLVKTCRTARKEGCGILYAENSFRFSDRRAWIVLDAFLCAIGTNRKYLTDVSVHVPEQYGRDLTRWGDYPWRVYDATEQTMGCVGNIDKVKQEMVVTMDRALQEVHGVWWDDWTYSLEHTWFRKTRETLRELQGLKKFSFVLPRSFMIHTRTQLADGSWVPSDFSGLQLHDCLPVDVEISLVILNLRRDQPHKQSRSSRYGQRRREIIPSWARKGDNEMGRIYLTNFAIQEGWKLEYAIARKKSTHQIVTWNKFQEMLGNMKTESYWENRCESDDDES
jgi:hypothetical protein